MSVIRCHICHEAISSYDFYLNLPQGTVCSSCIINRACEAGDLKVQAKSPEKSLDIGDLEALYPHVRPAETVLAAGGLRQEEVRPERTAIRRELKPNQAIRDSSVLDEANDDFWAMPGFSGKPA